ncbi:MAG TPA: hypothetical protein VFV93_02230 [Thermomicrobiales bacterium]|nr:hypothetical protein [Thermomicrobiales bacterium]
MVADLNPDARGDYESYSAGRAMSGDSLGVRESGSDQLTPSALDPAIFSMLLGRIEQLSRELGRAETQRTLVEQHIARLEQQIERLSRHQETVN